MSVCFWWLCFDDILLISFFRNIWLIYAFACNLFCSLAVLANACGPQPKHTKLKWRVKIGAHIWERCTKFLHWLLLCNVMAQTKDTGYAGFLFSHLKSLISLLEFQERAKFWFRQKAYTKQYPWRVVTIQTDLQS